MTAWHEGRTFYACPCGCQDERTKAHAEHPETLPCWGDKCGGTMKQWIPPAVARERAQIGGNRCGKTEAPRQAEIGEKVEHVRTALRTDRRANHHCHWPNCDAAVPAAAWGCKKHWYMLPKDMQRRIWRAFRPGQEESKTPSREYVAVAREVQDWIAANHPPQGTPKQESFL